MVNSFRTTVIIHIVWSIRIIKQINWIWPFMSLNNWKLQHYFCLPYWVGWFLWLCLCYPRSVSQARQWVVQRRPVCGNICSWSVKDCGSVLTALYSTSRHTSLYTSGRTWWLDRPSSVCLVDASVVQGNNRWLEDIFNSET